MEYDEGVANIVLFWVCLGQALRGRLQIGARLSLAHRRRAVSLHHNQMYADFCVRRLFRPPR